MFKKIQFPLLVFLGWRFAILFFQIFLQQQYLITSSSDTLLKRLFISWASYWDAAHYLSIATEGYKFPQQAFFPLWPILIKLGTFLSFSAPLSSYLLTFVLSLSNFILFYYLAKKLIGAQKAKWALIFFSFYPAAIFLHASYSENIFLFTTLLSFNLLERKKYMLASIVGGFTSASRIAGVALIATYLFIGTSFKKRIGMIMLGSIGLLAYMIYLYVNHNDFLFFIKAQLQWCQNAGRCGFVFPLKPLIDYLGLIISGKETASLFSIRFYDWISSVIFLSFLPLVLKKLPKRYFVYALIVLFMPLSSGTTTSMTRVTMTIFPIFFVLPYFLKNNFLKILILIILGLLQFRFVLLFTSFMWVA